MAKVWTLPYVVNDVIKLLILRSAAYAESSGWALNAISCILKRERQRGSDTEEEEATSSWKQRLEWRGQILPGACRGQSPIHTFILDFQPPAYEMAHFYCEPPTLWSFYTCYNWSLICAGHYEKHGTRSLTAIQKSFCFMINKRDIYISLLLFIQKCPTLCDPMDCSMPGFPVLLRLHFGDDGLVTRSCPTLATRPWDLSKYNLNIFNFHLQGRSRIWCPVLLMIWSQSLDLCKVAFHLKTQD